MTLEERAFEVLKNAHDLVKGESSFKTAQRITFCPEGEFWDQLDIDEEHVEDPENEARRYVDIEFESPKFMKRNRVKQLADVDGLLDRDQVFLEGGSITYRLIGGEPV